MMYLFAFIIGAAAGRIRGMDFLPNAVGRFGVWGIAVGGLVLGYTQNLYYALAATLLAGVGASFGYFGGQFALANDANRNPHNYVLLTLSGMVRMLPLVPLFPYAGIAVIAGMLFVPAYLAGLRIWPARYTAVGECLFWGAIYLALAVGLGL